MGKEITTEEHFEIFKEECEYWIKYFSINFYAVRYFHKDLKGSADESALALMRMNSAKGDRVCSMVLNKSWADDVPTDLMLRQTAFHEVMEIILKRLRNLGYEGWPDHYVDDEAHCIIRLFENSIFMESYRGRTPVSKSRNRAGTKARKRH